MPCLMARAAISVSMSDGRWRWLVVREEGDKGRDADEHHFGLTWERLSPIEIA